MVLSAILPLCAIFRPSYFLNLFLFLIKIHSPLMPVCCNDIALILEPYYIVQLPINVVKMPTNDSVFGFVKKILFIRRIALDATHQFRKDLCLGDIFAAANSSAVALTRAVLKVELLEPRFVFYNWWISKFSMHIMSFSEIHGEAGIFWDYFAWLLQVNYDKPCIKGLRFSFSPKISFWRQFFNELFSALFSAYQIVLNN